MQSQLLHSHEHTSYLAHSHSEGLGALLHELLEGWGLSHELTEFFSHIIVDCTEVIVLLLLVMTAVFLLQSYVNLDKLKEKLTHLHSIWGYALAALLGMLSPFCSCSIIPLMMGLLSMGVPLSVCLCMLTSASLLNISALMGISAMIGEFFFLYVLASLVLIVLSSFLMSRISFDAAKLHFHAGGECCHHEHHEHCHHDNGHQWKLKERLLIAFSDATSVLKSALPFIILGVALSAALSSFFPMERIIEFVDENSFLSVAVAALVGFPIHSDLFSALPVLRLLLELSDAAALSFALSTMSISVPSIILLSRILRPKTIAIYACVLLLLSFGLGWLMILL